MKKPTPDQDKVLLSVYKNPQNGLEDIISDTGFSKLKVYKIMTELREVGLIKGGADFKTEIANSLKEADPGFTETTPHFSEATILLASMFRPAVEIELAAELGFDLEFVNTIGSRLRASGIWNGKELNPKRKTEWVNELSSFYMDLMVASGQAVVSDDTGPETKYKMTETGLKDAANLVKSIRPSP